MTKKNGNELLKMALIGAITLTVSKILYHVAGLLANFGLVCLGTWIVCRALGIGWNIGIALLIYALETVLAIRKLMKR